MLECIDAAGLPKGVCNVVIGRGNTVGAELVRNADVDKISFTGSVAVGESIMRRSPTSRLVWLNVPQAPGTNHLNSNL